MRKVKRLTFQKVRASGLHCSVPLCTRSSCYNKEISFHSFPADREVRAEWLRKIRRGNFSPTRNSRVCCKHFNPTDVILTAGGMKRLQKGAVPVLFSWNGYQRPAPGVGERHPRPGSPAPDSGSEREMETDAVALDHAYCASELADEDEALLQEKAEFQHQLEALQLRQRVGVARLAGSDEDFRFYTRFASYRHFLAFWRLVEPAVGSKMVRITRVSKTTTKLPAIDELLLFLMHLSVGIPLRDLAERFDIHHSAASLIVSTWTRFLYRLLGSKRLWIPPQVVKAHLPPEFAAFPDTQVVLDCTEILCQTPSSLFLQSEVSPTSKSHATFKAMVGMAPHGAVTFVSGLYAGSLSDVEVFRLSGITKLLQPDAAIMVDRGFVVDNIAPCKVYRPALKNPQTSGDNVRQTEAVARLRVHVERRMRRVKENKLLDTVIPLSVCGNIAELFSVACFLLNYQHVR